jgi:hypothetical protein
MIDERTKDLPAERAGDRRKGFEALFSNGTISAEREVGGYDLMEFAPAEYPDFKLPGDYQGTRTCPDMSWNGRGLRCPPERHHRKVARRNGRVTHFALATGVPKRLEIA